MIGYSERKTELKLIKFHFETLPSVHSCYRSFVRGYIGQRFPTHTGLFLTGKAGARIPTLIHPCMNGRDNLLAWGFL